MRPRRKHNGDTRDAVWAKTGGHCYYCGDRFDHYTKMVCDHVIPVCDGGTDDLENLVPACDRCNIDKRSQSLSEYRRSVGRIEAWTLTDAANVAERNQGVGWMPAAELASRLREMAYQLANGGVRFFYELPTDTSAKSHYQI